MADTILSSAWWDKNRAKTLPSTGLGKALTEYERNVKEFERYVVRPVHPVTVLGYRDTSKALDVVEQSLKKASGKCNKTLHKETLANLGSLTTKALPKERKRVEQLWTAWNLKKMDYAKNALTDMKKRADAATKLRADVLQLRETATTNTELAVAAGARVQEAAQRGDAAAVAAARKEMAQAGAAADTALKQLDACAKEAAQLDQGDIMAGWPAGLFEKTDPLHATLSKLRDTVLQAIPAGFDTKRVRQRLGDAVSAALAASKKVRPAAG